jgi:hypothetical protein
MIHSLTVRARESGYRNFVFEVWPLPLENGAFRII